MKNTEDAVLIINNFFIDATNKSMSELVAYCKEFDLTDDQILLLAKGLAESGKVFGFQGENICDIPSTGGPASLSTLLCPLFLRLLNEKVLKLGVPGRPAGGIDVLKQIQGYNINPKTEEVEEWFSKSGYVHFLANENFTPLDSILFNYRKNNNLLNIPCLVIASLLSKKLAVGLKKVGLDVRVGEFGNFGKTTEEAKLNSKRFINVAKLAGIEAKCFITNAMIAQQPYIGRGESLLALRKIFSGEACMELKEHLSTCLEMSASVVEQKSINFTIIDLENVFFENVVLQQGSIESFYEKTEAVTRGHVFEIFASASGFLLIDLYRLRDVIVSAQTLGKNPLSDPCGVILKAKSGQFINKGDIICSYRYELDYQNEFETTLNSAFSILKDVKKIKNIEIIQ